MAYAIPYQKIMDAVMFGLAGPMYGAKPGAPLQVAWPQPHPYKTDLAKAKQLLAEAGHPNGFETTLSFDLGFAVVNEPLCVLMQESLAQVGIKTTINKIPGSNWRNELLKKEMPLITNFFSGWLDYPEYFFFWCYHGQNAVFNTMSYQDKDMDAHDRRGAHRGGQRRQGGLREERRGLRQEVPSTRCRASPCSSRR